MFRPSVLYAVTWRVLAELLRRHGASQELRLCAGYPGLSLTGFFQLASGLPCDSGEPRPRIELHLGGGHSGAVVVATPFGPPRASAGDLDWPHANYVRALLAAEDPKSVVDDIDALAGFPVVAELPAATPSALCQGSCPLDRSASLGSDRDSVNLLHEGGAGEQAA